MKNKKELSIVVAISVILTIMLFSVLGMGTGCGPASPKETARMAECTSHCKQFAVANYLYSTIYNGYVTPAAYGTESFNIWPAIIWNMTGSTAQMPYVAPSGTNVSSGDKVWADAVRASKFFQCPADRDSNDLGKKDDSYPVLSYGINRSAVRDTEGADDAASLPSRGVYFKVTRFKLPSQMIYIGDAAWNTSASASGAPGRLYSTMKHPKYGFTPGSINSPADQSSLGPEFNNKNSSTAPRHTGKTWIYAFIDGHAANYRPEQTVIASNGSKGNIQEPSGYWTWNQKPWGQE